MKRKAINPSFISIGTWRREPALRPQMVQSGGRFIEIRVLVSGNMESQTHNSFVTVSSLHNLEKSTLAKGELGIMKRNLSFGIKKT